MGPKNPNKKTKVTDEEKEKEMIARSEALLTDIYENKTVDPTECAKAQLFLSFNCKAQISQLDKRFEDFKESYDDKVEEIEGRLDEIELRNRELEILLVTKDIVLRKIPLHKDAQNSNESNEQTKEQLQNFFDSMKFQLQPFEFPECHRLPSKNDKPGDQEKRPNYTS